jgi:hypothetical protein
MHPLVLLLQRLSTDGIDLRTRLSLEQGGHLNLGPSSVRGDGVGSNEDTNGSNQQQPRRQTTEPPLLTAETVQQYRIQPWVTTVAQLWEEYDKGLPTGIGMPRALSIRELNERYGTKWRRDQDFRKPYGRRRFIWEEVIAASANLRLSGEEVAKRIDRWRSSQTPSVTLQKLNDLLAKVSSKKANPLWGEKHIELLKYV